MMIEFNALNVVNVIALCLMLFFWGLSIDRSEETQKVSKMIHWFFLAVVWICILVR